MQCPRCQDENPAAAKFCGECGTRLSAAWPACGHGNPPGQNFCWECGAALAVSATSVGFAPSSTVPAAPPSSPFRDAAPVTYTPKHLAEKILTSKSAVEGERKGVTVMFTDVSGFTAMSERLDPEEVHAIMDRAFEVILAAVHRYEGTINQFLGDGVMALFGAPIAHEDHPDRALRAALTIQKGLEPLRYDVRHAHGVDFRVRMGINTGLVFVGAIGKDLRMDYTAVGDTTNLAARLLGLAKPGQIVVSRSTQHLRDKFFTFEDLGEFQVKGKAEPVRAYELTGEIRGRTRLEVSKERGLTPLVGRDRELQRLTEAYRRAAGGQGTIVSLAGQPGVGKSRLLYEFLRSLEGEGIPELTATCVSYGGSIPYHPILELLRRYLGLLEGMTEEEIRRRVADRLRSLGVEGEEAAILLAHFLGVSAPSEFLTRVEAAQLKERTFGFLLTMFLRASETEPVVLVVENLHWVDTSSEEFLSYFSRGLADHRVLLVFTTRPGFPAPWLTPPLAETVTLEGLDAKEVQGMIRTLLAAEEVSEQLFEILVEKSEGNPLYVEEILRQLQETAGIIIEDGKARLRRPDVKVPGTIQDIIVARIDRLAEPLKHTLQVGAVLGREFSVSLLARVLESNGELVGHLRELHSLDFVFLSAEEPELSYSFKHALTQEVAYASLLERRRRQYHAAAGLGLEQLYAGRTDEVVELVAYHFGRSAEGEKAVDYSILAAEKAQRRWASTEALAHFEAAVKRIESMPDTTPNRLRRIDAVVKQAEIKFALGRHAEHIQALEEIREAVEGIGDMRRRAAWYYWTGLFHSLIGSRPEVSMAYCSKAASIADTEGLEDVKAFAESCLAHVYLTAGKLADALAAGDRALEYFEARGNVWWACRTLWALISATNVTGEWERGLEYCRRALEHGQAANDLRLKVTGWWRTGSTHVQRGDPQAGLRCCEEALALSPIPFDAANIKAVKGYGLVKAGKTKAGIVELTEALSWLQQSHLEYVRAFYALWLAEGHLREGERLRARAIVEEILATSREVSRRVEGMAERLLGETLVSDDPAAAVGHLEAAMRIFEAMGARNELGKALVAQAELSRANGDSAGARQLLERALAIFEKLGTLDEPARVRAALAAL